MSFGGFLGKIAPIALTVAAIAVTGGAAAGVFAAGTLAAGSFGAIALSAGLTLAAAQIGASNAKKAAKKAARRAAAEAARGQAVQGAVAGGTESHQLVFGTVRVGGLIMNEGTYGPSNVSLFVNVAHSLSHPGGIEGVSALYLNEKRVPLTVSSLVTEAAGTSAETRYFNSVPASGDAFGMAQVRTYLGLHTQNISGDLVRAPLIVATDHAKGIAWSRFLFTRDLANDPAFQRAFGGTIPSPGLELKGLKCYDPRLDSTRGGSGSQRAEDPLTWTFTDNAALVLLTYKIMRSADGGCGQSIASMDYVAFANAANACDALIGPTGAQVRTFAFNGALNTADDCDANVDRICAMMAGDCWLDIASGLWTCRAGVYLSPVATITDDWLADGLTVINGSGIGSLYNAVRANYSSPAANYAALACYPFTNAAYEAEDGDQRLYRDLSLPCCINEYQAQYLAQIEGRRSRNQRRVALTVNLRGLTVSTGQTVQLALSNLDEIGGSNIYLIESHSLLVNSDGALLVALGLVEERSDAYAVDTFGSPSTSTAYADIYETPGFPLFTSVTPVADGSALKWVPPPATSYTLIEVEVSSAVGGPYSLVAAIKGDRLTYPETTGALLYFRLRALNAQGQYSPYSAVISSTGKIVANGADNSTVSVQALVLNPSFEAGDYYWLKDTGWSIVQDTANARTGDWVAQVTGSGTTLALFSTRRIPASFGSVVTAEFWMRAGAGADGQTQTRIGFYNSAGTQLFPSGLGMVVSAAAASSWVQSRAIGIAPAGTAYALISQAVSLTTGTWYCDDANVEYHVSDVRQTPNSTISGLGATTTAATLTATSAGNVSVNAFTLQTGSLAVSYNAVTNAVTGLTGGTGYYIYTDDPTYQGGTRTYSATISSVIANNQNGRVTIGYIVVPGAGAADPSPDPSCVWMECWLPDGRQIKDVQIGDIFSVLDAQGNRRGVAVTQAQPALAQGLMLRTASGYELPLSKSTPLDLRDGGVAFATDMLGREIRCEARDGRLWWEPVTEAIELGLIPVKKITAGDASYAVSTRREGPFLYSHNLKYKP